MIIADGVSLDENLKKNTIWFECSRAKGEGQKGLWTHRYLEYFLKYTDASIVLRVDPDTCVWRNFALPVGDYDIFGTIEPRKYRYPYVLGGCIGFTRECAQKIVDSKLLLDSKFKHFNYQRYKHHRWEHEVESDEQIAFQDWIVADVAFELNLKLQEWKEICILGNYKRVPKIETFAITHPHPLLKDYHA